MPLGVGRAHGVGHLGHVHLQRVDAQVVDGVDTEQHDHEQEQHDDRAGVDDHLHGGEEVRLTDAKGVDDGPEYTPDGRWIYFNSSRTGRMQIWRMRPDGTELEHHVGGQPSWWWLLCAE